MSNQIIPAQNEDNEDQVEVQASLLLPPNQILTKNYTPDLKPTFKLIISEKQQQPKVKIINNIRNQYGDIFRQCDTLAYEYCVMIKKQLVYLKLNNADYMKLSLRGKTVKYLAGFFVPLQKLLDETLKIYKNVYKMLPRLDYIDNKHPIENSFSSNCFSQTPLKFSSNYQSANLFAAVRTSQTEYDLILQNDINSKGNTQWFNFTVLISEQRNYKFNIVNLTKSSSLYQKGMTVAIHSQASKLMSRTGWTRGCHNIAYSRTNINREDNQNSYYYKLHFEYKSLYKNDVVTFAYCFPYTMLDLQKFFNKIQFKRVVNSLKIQKIKIGETLSGFSLYVYSITRKRPILGKKDMNSYRTIGYTTSATQIPSISSIVFMARQHPGQSQGSYVLQGVVDWLIQNEHEGWKKTFNVYIVPMINMDGVYYGNYRTNLSGNDLNRVWRQPRKDYHCQIYSLKKYLHELNKLSPISLIIDIHGHSNSLNSFFYGNPAHKDSQNPKLFPYYCSRKVKQISFHQSTFSVSEDKKSCARVVLGEMFPKALVYTFQNSFCGWRRGKHLMEHSIQSYRKLGKQLVQCFVEYFRLSQKNPLIKERWLKQMQQSGKEPRVDEEEVLNESDGEIQGELIDFMDKIEEQLDTSLNKELNGKANERKRQHQSMGKTKFLKYKHRTSPMKLKNYSSRNQAYVQQKLGDISESMGFLSIVRINTRSNIDSHNQSDNAKLIQIRNAVRRYQQKRQEKDQIIQDEHHHTKQNTSQQFIKVGKLMGEKDLASEKIRMRRMNMEEGPMRNKIFNGFFKYNLGQK